MSMYLRKNKGLCFLTILFALLASTSMVLVTKQYEWFFDAAAEGNIEVFFDLVMIAFSFISVIFIFFYIYLRSSKKLIKNILEQLREHTFQGILSKDIPSFFKENTSSYISSLTNDINMVEENWLKPVIGICEQVGMFVATVCMLLYYSPLITFIIFVTSCIAFLIPTALGRFLAKRQSILSKELASFTNRIKDFFSGFEVIFSFHIHSYICESFGFANQKLASKKYLCDRFKVMNDLIAQCLGITIQVGTSCLCAYLVMKGDMSIGVLAAVIQLCSRFITPLMQIMNNLALIKSIQPVVTKLMDLASVAHDEEGISPTFTSCIQIDDVSFSYDDKKQILQGVQLRIQKNKKYAIMGASGCGKSTLVKLLLGYYKTYTGNIFYDQHELKSLSCIELHKIVSMIQQSVYLFDDTLKENICLHEQFSDDLYAQAIHKSGCDQILLDALQGDYVIGENGSTLSGGQKQRIALARALIRDTSLLILDEGTSAVDMQNAHDIEHRLLQNEDLTLLSILHRTSEDLLCQYDEIIYMDQGAIIERGSFQDLMKHKGLFYAFYSITEN